MVLDADHQLLVQALPTEVEEPVVVVTLVIQVVHPRLAAQAAQVLEETADRQLGMP